MQVSLFAAITALAATVSATSPGPVARIPKPERKAPAHEARAECEFGSWACLDDFVLNCDATGTWRTIDDCGAGSGCCAEFNGGAQCIC